jgi:hypothetical protein
MLVVVMVAMIMRMVMIVVVMMVTMAMRRMIVRGGVMRLNRRMRVSIAGIGAAFRIERGFDLDHPRAEPFHHILNDVVATDSQSARRDLRRQVAITEMPADANEMLRIGATDFQQWLCCCHDLDQTAVLEHQRIAAAQRGCLFQIEQELEPACAGHRHPPPVAIVEIEHNRVSGRLRPAMLRLDLGGADHFQTPL